MPDKDLDALGDAFHDYAWILVLLGIEVLRQIKALSPQTEVIMLTAYETLIGLFPSSPLIPVAKKELAALNEMFAQKNYLSGMYYLRRKAHDSAIIYFKDVVSKYPEAPSARLAQLRLVDAYKAIRYKDDAADQCAELRRLFPDDAEVRTTCAGVALPAPSTADSTKATPPATGPPSR